MNIQFNNWQQINLVDLENGLNAAITEFDNLLIAFDPNSPFINEVDTNTRITGIWNGLNVDLRGNHFIDSVPIVTLNSFSLFDGNINLFAGGALSYNFNNGLYGGFLNKLTYVSTNINLLIEGKFNVDSITGDFAGGTATKYNISFNGYTLNLLGSILLNANDDIVSGTVTSFTFTDNLGHNFAASGLSLNAHDFDTLTDPLTHTSLVDLYTLVNDPSRFTGSDIITGDANANALNGYAGNDTLNGLAGSDALIGGLGADTLDGGADADSMNGGDGNDTYIVDDVGDTVTEDNALVAGGIDIVKSSALGFTLSANVENLTLTDGTATGGTAAINGTGNELNNVIIGNAGDNILIGGAGKDTLTGNAGNDTLDGGLGVDALTGGAGDDTYYVDLIETGATHATTKLILQDSITDATGVDTLKLRGSFTHDFTYPISTITLASTLENLDANLITGSLRLNLTGNALNNTITGSNDGGVLSGLAGNDTLIGGTGDDVLIGGLGADTLKGGAGNDTYDITDTLDVIDEEGNTDTWDTVVYRVNASASITSTLAAGSNNTVQLTATTTASLDLTNIENIILVGTGKYNLVGNAQQNQLLGNAANNVIDGEDGNDFLDGGAGLDTLIGGAGDDTYTVDSLAELNLIVDSDINNTLITNFSFALTNTGPFNNLYLNGMGAFNATGNDNDNILWGNGAANILNGGLGADFMDGGDGNDTYIVDNKKDQVVEWNALAAGGIDTVQSLITFDLSDNSNFDIRDNIEKLTLTGADKIDGTGNTLANTITGNANDNKLYGGAGIDTLIGGLGNDTYIVDLTAAGALQDTVTEGVSAADIEDKIKLRGVSTNLTAVTLSLGANLEILDASETSSSKLNLTGNALANTLTGNAADNILDGGTGADNLAGGAGNDTYLVDSFGDIVTENLDEGTDLVKISITTAGGFYSLADNVENATLINGVAFELDGNILNNVLIGNAAANGLVGFEGNDTLDGKAGADTMLGGLNDDTYFVDNAGDLVTEGFNEGTDLVNSSISYTLGDNLENLTLIGVAAINGTGNADNNIIIGNSAANILIGGEGHDDIYGGAGNDTLIGGLGEDHLYGGAGNDTYVIDNALDMAIEDIGLGDTGGIDLVLSSIDYRTDSYIEKLTLTGTAISATGNALANTLTGNIGNNIFDGGLGVDTLIGGLGNDTYIVDLTVAGALQDTVTEGVSAADTADKIQLRGISTNLTAVTLTLGVNLEILDASDTAFSKLNLTGNTLNNTLIGNDANNILSGLAGNDELNGGLGNDTLDGGTGVDSLTGGTGDDTYLVDIIATTTGATPAPVLVTGAKLQDNISEVNGTTDGIDTLKLRGSVVIPAATLATNIALTGSLASIENLDISLTGTTRLNLTGNTENNILLGNAANNVIDGDIGNDSIDGGAGNDSLVGGDGNDTLIGGLGIDTMVGGIGNDTYVVDGLAEANSVVDTDGSNTLIIGLNYTLADAGAFTNLTLSGVAAINGTGNTGANILMGNGAANILNGNGGADTLIGGDGADTYVIDSLDDVVIEANTLAAGGLDLVRAKASFTLSTNVENLTLIGSATNSFNGTGNALNNVITGDDGNNILSGLDGNDTLIGGLGGDTLIGGLGNDMLSGGAGQDVFVFDTILNAITNKDTIQGFNTTDDQIQLDASIFSTIGLALDANEFRSGAGITTAATIDQHIIFNSTTGALYYDADGLGGAAATQFATLTGAIGTLTIDDFF